MMLKMFRLMIPLYYQDLTSSREAPVVATHYERHENSTATHAHNEVDYLIPPPSVGPISDLDWTE